MFIHQVPDDSPAPFAVIFDSEQPEFANLQPGKIELLGSDADETVDVDCDAEIG